MGRDANHTRLVVFSDDWGRHPSSCQHLVRRLLPRHATLWVNTIGTRRPGISLGDLKKIAVKLRQWMRPRPAAMSLPANLSVISPPMWPGFKRSWQRRWNARLLARGVNRALGPRPAGERRVVVTTLPITADLVGRVDADRWVYYCVDDFSVWPGMDAQVMRDMERELLGKVQATSAVSETLVARLSGLGADPVLLTHGIDLEHWAKQPVQPEQAVGQPVKYNAAKLPPWCRGIRGPIFLFWGLIDRRLDTDWCRTLAGLQGGTLVLVGPVQEPDPALATIPGLVMPGPLAYEELPGVAAWADVLVMPYADLPVTRAMQPLKFKEYLATGRPVVVRSLPATRLWADAADVVENKEQLPATIRRLLTQGLPAAQQQARQRLTLESWDRKAEQFEALVVGEEFSHG